MPEGGLLGQASERSVPVCGTFVVYSSYDLFSPKTRGLWTHITVGPKKWGQARGSKLHSLLSRHTNNLQHGDS